MTMIFSALLVLTQLSAATQSVELEMSLVKTLSKSEVLSLLEVLSDLSQEIASDAPPIFDLGQFQSLDAETKATLLPKLKRHGLTLDSFTEGMTALFSAYFTTYPEELESLLPKLKDPAVVAWCKAPGRAKADVKKLRKKIRELQDNKGFMLAQLELTSSAPNQTLIRELQTQIQKTLKKLKSTLEVQK